MSFVLRNWRAFAVLGLALAIIAALWLYGRSKYQAGYEAARDEIQSQLETERQHQKEIYQEVQRQHEQQIAQVRKDAARELRGRPIRCVLGDSDQVRVPGDSGAASPGSGDQHAVRADVDLRPQIVRVGETCEQLRQQLIAIKAWQEKQLAPR